MIIFFYTIKSEYKKERKNVEYCYIFNNIFVQYRTICGTPFTEHINLTSISRNNFDSNIY